MKIIFEILIGLFAGYCTLYFLIMKIFKVEPHIFFEEYLKSFIVRHKYVFPNIEDIKNDFAKCGIDVIDKNTQQYKSTGQVFEELANNWDGLTVEQKTSIKSYFN